MQKLLTLFVFSVLFFTANAQFQKGNKVLNASLYVQSSNSKNKTISSSANINVANLSLGMGFAKKANRLDGFFVNTGYGKTKNEVALQISYKSITTSFSAGAGYFSEIYKPLWKGFFVYGAGVGNVYYSKEKSETNITTNFQQYAISFGVSPGLAYKWNDRFMLDIRLANFAAVSYSYGKTKSTDGNNVVSNNFSFNSSLGLGYLNNIGIGARWVMK